MCTDEEVVDIAGPRLSATMSSWEYLLLRVQQEDEGNSSAPLIPRILNEVTSLLDRVSSMASRHLHQQSDGQHDEPYELTNPETARLINLQCGTYFISKDERKLLEEDPSVQFQDPLATTTQQDEMKDSAAAAASKLWEELEHLPTTADDQCHPHGDADADDENAVESELMQVDEIVNQVVEGQTGSQAPSPL